MPVALALAPLTLAAVLVLSGVAKLGDPGSTASMIRLLRLPSFLAGAVVPRLLPVVELVAAVLLLTPWIWTYAVGAALALGLFTAFLLVVARAMTFDPRPTCGCFGRVGNHQITARTVWRNVLLLALALVASWIALGGSAAGALVARFSAGDWLWLVLAVGQATVAVLVLGGAGSESRTPAARRRDRGAAESTRAPDELDYVRRPFPRGSLLSQDLEPRTLHALTRHRAQLLVLANCWCGSTMDTIARLEGWRERLPQLDVQLVHTHRPWDAPELSAVQGVWWDPGSTLYDALGAGVSPAAVLLGMDGLLAGGPVNGVNAIEEFVEDIAAELAQAEVPADQA
ncbi:MauE/DoxX family redox-associated membrane protein [Ornithinimicrobium tianjinense]|nr:MauE/DoxX family redox-associated membrane protein [Ornithinimicrobium tianjinense]